MAPPVLTPITICTDSPNSVTYQILTEGVLTGTYTITFQNTVMDPATECFNHWSYLVTQTGNPGISHIVIPVAICNDTPTPISNVSLNGLLIPEGGSTGARYELTFTNGDPETCIRGVKFEGITDNIFTASFDTPARRPVGDIVGLKAGDVGFTDGTCVPPGNETTTLGCDIWSPGCESCSNPPPTPCVNPVTVTCTTRVAFDVTTAFTLTLDDITIDPLGCECQE